MAFVRPSRSRASESCRWFAEYVALDEKLQAELDRIGKKSGFDTVLVSLANPPLRELRLLDRSARRSDGPAGGVPNPSRWPVCYAWCVMLAIPASSRWIFWDVDPDAIDLERDANGVLSRILERGCLDDVKWLIQRYGLERIHTFFREVWTPEVSERTRGFWRALFEAENETWASPPAFRRNSSSLWNA